MKITSILLILFISGCGNLKPDAIQVASYPEIEKLLSGQIPLLESRELQKEVWLDGETELRQLTPDSATWAQELSFLKEINPNQSGYVGAFDKSEDDRSLLLKLQEGEKGSLTYFSYTSTNDLISITATIHEDKDVYVHHKEVVVNLAEDKIKDYQITGYQKILLKDTIRFKIKGVVVN